MCNMSNCKKVFPLPYKGRRVGARGGVRVMRQLIWGGESYSSKPCK